MKTKFILHGGESGADTERNTEFYKEMVRGIDNPTIVIIYYAREENPKDLFAWDSEKIHKRLDDVPMTLEMASENLSELYEQLEQAHVIFVKGGNDLTLLEKLGSKRAFVDRIRGKVYAGTSAGMNILAERYYANDRDRVEEGLGILKIKSLPHYDDSKKEALEMLNDIGDALPIVTVAEGDFIVINENI